ncbi:MAG: HEAT repeat domain-containing protein [Desulfovibrionaceae bacterium]|nr:HEAT repeat domain-containing protein [Desulfovibrionaceae bacterium]
MARMRQAKGELKGLLSAANWREYLPTIAQGGVTHIGPLFSFLLLEPLMMHKAAVALGATCSYLSETSPEKARNVVRRYMWHLSEESGNIGWGIPEAFAETLVQSKLLAQEFYKILITYVIDLGREDNYCDNNYLRRSCFWACGRFAEQNQALCLDWRKWLAKGLDDEDVICRGMACFALTKLPLDFSIVPKLQSIAQGSYPERCVLFDGEQLYEQSVSDLAMLALRRS